VLDLFLFLNHIFFMAWHIPLLRAAFSLKRVQRQGWLHHEIPSDAVESVAAHSFGVGFFVILLEEEGLIPTDVDVKSLLTLSILHDLPESKIGDITPRDGISKEEKHKLEFNALEIITVEDGLVRDSITRLLKEDGPRDETIEFFKQVDKLDMMVTALFYEDEFGKNLGEFYEPDEKYLTDQGLQSFFKNIKRAIMQG
jgi:putative hydrolase of HD superfamily